MAANGSDGSIATGLFVSLRQSLHTYIRLSGIDKPNIDPGPDTPGIVFTYESPPPQYSHSPFFFPSFALCTVSFNFFCFRSYVSRHTLALNGW